MALSVTVHILKGERVGYEHYTYFYLNLYISLYKMVSLYLNYQFNVTH